MNFRFAIGVNRSETKFHYRSGGQGGGVSTGAETNKTVLTLEAFPFNFKLLKHLQMNSRCQMVANYF